MTPTDAEPTDALLDRVGAWIADDPESDHGGHLEALRRAAESGQEDAEAELRDLFGGTLAFGTAGLRAALGAGPLRMNVAVVRRAAAGVGAWVLASEGARGVVVGRDGRHGSESFVAATVAVLLGAGLDVHVLPAPIPTPVLAYAARHLEVGAGIMVTASHNPAADNGYKVFDGEGRQVAGDQASVIAAAMAQVESIADLPQGSQADRRHHVVGSDIVDEYLAATRRAVLGPSRSRAPISVAHTSLHGVGAPAVRQACREAGFITLYEVDAQASCDPDFPTVTFPNPEEPGTLDLLLAHAAYTGVDVALANDPDADRLAMAVCDPHRGERHEVASWRVLTGDELGWLLADHLVRRGRLPDGALMVTTIVSSTLLRALAAEAGVAYAETLTGFKWIVRAPRADQTLAFGYEEALGYCVGDLVLDKDGIAALLLAAELVSDLLDDGRTVIDALDDLARRFGVHLTGQWSTRLEGTDGAARLDHAMSALRSNPPSHIGGRAVARVTDLADGASGRVLPTADVVGLALEGARVIVRPSGTEPKLKCYVEVVEPVPEGTDLAAARGRAEVALAALLADIPAVVGLG